MKTKLTSEAAALLATLDKVAQQTALMNKLAVDNAEGLRSGRLQPQDIQQTLDLLTGPQGVDFETTLGFFAPAPSATEVNSDGPSRYHLEKGAIIIHTHEGPKPFGRGWLLISESEYAGLVSK